MTLTVLFDDQCGKCRRYIRLSTWLDLAGRLEPIGLSNPRIAREFSHFDPDALNFEMHVIDSRGRVFRGFYAIRRIAQAVPLMWPFAALLFFPGVSAAGEPIYAWIARTRYGSRGPIQCKIASPAVAAREKANRD
jgi:predicted DCC family thiol-disulfide oxidoreductase YuxK